MVKEWVMLNQKLINFHSHNKVIVKCCVEYYHECWNRRCVVLYNQEVKNKVLREEALSFIEEASKEEVEGLRRYV